ncbi:MAG: aspartate 1-decarboxylase [Sedimentisphaeraceae bacterium JB056]
MYIKALKSKIHRATVTGSELEYPGSIGIDKELLDAAGMKHYETVLVANANNGERVETYVVPAEPGSGKVTVLGAAARKFEPGDVVIILNFAYYKPEEFEGHKPVVVIPDSDNKIKEVQ